jgi:hypothetical protein
MECCEYGTRLLNLFANIRLGLKNFSRTNTLAFFVLLGVAKNKSYITMAPEHELEPTERVTDIADKLGLMLMLVLVLLAPF